MSEGLATVLILDMRGWFAAEGGMLLYSCSEWQVAAEKVSRVERRGLRRSRSLKQLAISGLLGASQKLKSEMLK